MQSAVKHIITDYMPCYSGPAQEELNSFLVPRLKATLNTTFKSNNYIRTEKGSNSKSSQVYLNNYSDTLYSNS